MDLAFNVDYFLEFCLTQIALEGLQGCSIDQIFHLFGKQIAIIVASNEHEPTLFIENEMKNLKILFDSIKDKSSSTCNLRNFVWQLLANQSDLNFYKFTTNSSNVKKETYPEIDKSKQTKPSSKSSCNTNSKKLNKLSNIVNLNGMRGFSSIYSQLVLIQIDSKKTYEDLLDEFGSDLIIIASQSLRNRVLCPSFKLLDLETLNDLEYCVLEAIGKCRQDGIYTIGEKSLTQLFDLAPKQLHYILVILETHELIRKQVLASEKKKSIIHLARFSLKKQSLLEKLCIYLMEKNVKRKEGYHDSFINLKRKFCIGNKQFKTLVYTGEKQNMLERYFQTKEYLYKKNKNSLKSYQRVKKIRMVRLTDSYYKQMLNETQLETTINADLMNEDGFSSEMAESELNLVGMQQSNIYPLYTQIFAKLEECAHEGISLKQLGTLFGLDFYKARRMGANLQAHPEIVTIIKETDRGKAKYQTIVLRKFLIGSSSKKVSTSKSRSNSSNDLTNNSISLADSSLNNESIISQEDEESEENKLELTTLKRDGQAQNIQALMSNRMLNRKKLIMDYLDRHKICTKYEITKEIRKNEAELGLKGCIDSKTIKRMLIAMEKEQKLHIFNLILKNVNYMCVRSFDIGETDNVYVNYCATFNRTFDSVNIAKQDDRQTLIEDNSQKSSPSTSQKSINQSSSHQTSDEHTFKLTRQFIKSVVERLEFSSNYGKVYSLAPKFQKAVILHRFLHYLLYFYDGEEQTDASFIKQLNDEHQMIYSNKQDQDIVESCSIPKNAYKRSIDWCTFIPPLSQTSSVKNCLFIGEIFSHMPLSVFCSIIVINYKIPGLVSILKHPVKRHILVKDLPPNLIAPLIYERRYLQRILAILQLLACLGLITFVESPCKTNQAANRDVQSQMVYVHRQACFYDTSSNRANDWNELASLNKVLDYTKYNFHFNSSDDVVDFWSKLVNVSMSTYKFNVSKYLHENKRLRQQLLTKVTVKEKIESINEPWPIENYGDRMGPGAYDSQLFLNSFKNWMLPSNVGHNNSSLAKSSSANKILYKNDQLEPAITKEADQSSAPLSELALYFSFSLFRGILSSNASNESPSVKRVKKIEKAKETASRSSKRKLKEIDSYEKNRELHQEEPRSHDLFKFKRPRLLLTNKKTQTTISLKQLKARNLIERAKIFKAQTSNTQNLKSINGESFERRAIWSSDEDELILLIKIAFLYFVPNERSVPFKLIQEIMVNMLPEKCANKKITSFGRRIKMLLKSKVNVLFVSNKLELCRQDDELTRKYSNALKSRRVIDSEQVYLFINFIRDIQEKYIKKSSVDYKSLSEQIQLELPDSIEEFHRIFKIRNVSHDIILKNPQSYFQQPTSDYEITCHTVQSAIHVRFVAFLM